MAYVATVACEKSTISGRRYWLIEVTQTEARDTSEWNTRTGGSGITITVDGVETPIDLPRIGTITHRQVQKVAGTGTTVQQRIGKVTGHVNDTNDEVTRMAAAAAFLNSGTKVQYTFKPGVVPEFFVRTTPNDTTADHTLHTLIVVMEGHAE
jgi:hypothetical protein